MKRWPNTKESEMRRALFLLLSLTLVFSVAAFAQEQTKPPEKKAPEMSAEMKAMMEAYAKAGTPGAPHKLLASMEGSWTAVVKWWPAPGAPPDVSEGESENEMVLDGRYLEESFSGTAMGKPFEGIGYTAYDNVLKKYVGTWMDSMSTGIATSIGEADASGKTIEYTMTFADPLTGKSKTSREVLKIPSPDKHVMEMYEKGPDGKEYLQMEITYTRDKE
jgi:hypothetical protein